MLSIPDHWVGGGFLLVFPGRSVYSQVASPSGAVGKVVSSRGFRVWWVISRRFGNKSTVYMAVKNQYHVHSCLGIYHPVVGNGNKTSTRL